MGKNVDPTHLELDSGKLVLQKSFSCIETIETFDWIIRKKKFFLQSDKMERNEKTDLGSILCISLFHSLSLSPLSLTFDQSFIETFRFCCSRNLSLATIEQKLTKKSIRLECSS